MKPTIDPVLCQETGRSLLLALSLRAQKNCRPKGSLLPLTEKQWQARVNLGSFATAEEAALHVARSRRRGGRRRSAGGAGSSGAKAEAGIECLALTLNGGPTRFSTGDLFLLAIKAVRAYVGYTGKRVVGRGRGCSDGSPELPMLAASSFHSIYLPQYAHLVEVSVFSSSDLDCIRGERTASPRAATRAVPVRFLPAAAHAALL
eukprot:scaffold58088_cov58-Phaeocystis_antarctica.AAC.2